MLHDPEEIELISKAAQVNLRDPRRPRTHFVNILEDFFSPRQFSAKTILDLGPGHFDLGELTTLFGAVVDAIDNDPAVIALGRHKGFSVFELDLTNPEPFVASHSAQYDGIFCKFSFNAFSFSNPHDLKRNTDQLCALMKEDAWAWLAPWNGSYQELPERLRGELLRVQIDSFLAKGFHYFEVNKWQSLRYGIHGLTANRPIFTRHLSFKKPSTLKVFTGLCRQRLASIHRGR